MFHFDKWNKNGKKLAMYLNDNATDEEFNKLDKCISRLENIINDKTKELFTTKDSFIWITLFDRFLKTGLDDKKFSEFLAEFVNGLRNKAVDGKLFDTVDNNGSTKDKSVIADKLHILVELMNEFLHIDTTEENNTELENTYMEENEQDNSEETTLSFVQENANPDATEEDIEFYRDMVEDCVKVDEPVYQQCERAVIAIMAYACTKEQDEEFEKWIQKYKNQTNFSPSQKTNFTYMKNSFDKFVQKMAV